MRSISFILRLKSCEVNWFKYPVSFCNYKMYYNYAILWNDYYKMNSFLIKSNCMRNEALTLYICMEIRTCERSANQKPPYISDLGAWRRFQCFLSDLFARGCSVDEPDDTKTFVHKYLRFYKNDEIVSKMVSLYGCQETCSEDYYVMLHLHHGHKVVVWLLLRPKGSSHRWTGAMQVITNPWIVILC